MSEVIGVIKMIGAEQNVSASFKKRELVVVSQEQYPQSILIEFAQDKCDLLNKFSVGQEVNVGINIRGREWVNPQGETKYFNSLQGWKINALTTAEPQKPASAPVAPVDNEKEEDGLPF